MPDVEGRLGRQLGACVADFDLIEAGDRIMVCLSGGKDSYTLLQLLMRLRRRAPISFELLAFHLDQVQPGHDVQPMVAWLEQHGVDYVLHREDTYSVVVDKVDAGQTYCGLCSRLRRGIIYTQAKKLGCSKIALGHHRDDALETLLLNLMFNGSLGAMPAKLSAKEGEHTVIRPLLYCAESLIATYAAQQRFPILPCNLCGSQDNLMRQKVKQWLTELDDFSPRARENMLAALGNVRPSHLLDASVQRHSASSGPTMNPLRVLSAVAAGEVS